MCVYPHMSPHKPLYLEDYHCHGWWLQTCFLMFNHIWDDNNPKCFLFSRVG